MKMFRLLNRRREEVRRGGKEDGVAGCRRMRG
jgi:hypothetical protein